MNVNLNIKPNEQIRSFYLFFIIASIQIGVGIMGVPRLIYKEAGRDAWLSVLIAFCYISLLLAVMLFMLKQYKNADIFSIQTDIFGTFIGKVLGTFYIVYFMFNLFTVLITYVEVLTIFIFPELNKTVMSLLLMSLVIYSVLGGIRVIVGICFLFFIFSHWLAVLLIEPIMDMDWTHFQPMFQASFTELLKGAKQTSYTLTGIELLFLLYPFIQYKKTAKFPVFLGVVFSCFTILIATVLVTGYFTPEGIDSREWSVLGLFKSQSFSFLERFDYIVVAEWMMVSLPNMVLFSWAVTYGLKRLYHLPQKKSLYILGAATVITSIFTNEHYIIQTVINITAQMGIWIVYVYPFILLPFVLFKRKLKRRRKVDDKNER